MERALFFLEEATLHGLGLLVIVPLLAIPILRWRGEPDLKRRLLWIAAVTMPWVALASLCAVEWPDLSSHHRSRLQVVGSGLFVVTVLAACAGIVANRGARWFFLGWGIVNVWFAAIGVILFAMAVAHSVTPSTAA
ncbi:hypothetical protein [Phenylobacterium sp.]|jgi:hypothetical protein|uniref:hypothetical protein n=1 Tax=Phenylobacterium sp. TaxID=1871053 RepID=UPI0037846A50